MDVYRYYEAHQETKRAARRLRAFLDDLPGPEITPSLTHMLNDYIKDRGRILPMPVKAPYAHIADYKVGSPLQGRDPEIRLSDRADDSSLIHELRHHHQAKVMDKAFDRMGLHYYPRKVTLIEADAHTAEALLILEKKDALIRLRECGMSNPDAHRSMTILEKNIEAHVDKLGKATNPGIFSSVFNQAALYEPLAQPEKLQFLRTVFDSYIQANQCETAPYRQQQIGILSEDKSAAWLPSMFGASMPVVTALAGSMPSMTMTAVFLTACGALQIKNIQDSRALCAQTDKHDTAALLATLGALPGEQGNYMTETQGPALDSDFYHNIPEAMSRLIDDKEEEIKRSLNPVRHAAHKISTLLQP